MYNLLLQANPIYTHSPTQSQTPLPHNPLTNPSIKDSVYYEAIFY